MHSLIIDYEFHSLALKDYPTTRVYTLAHRQVSMILHTLDYSCSLVYTQCSLVRCASVLSLMIIDQAYVWYRG